MDSFSIRQAIPFSWRSLLFSNTTEIVEDPDTKPRLYFASNGKDLHIVQAPSNIIYWLLIQKTTHRHKHVPPCIQRKENIYPSDSDLQPLIFKLWGNLSSIFQDRMIRCILPCNEWLVKGNIVAANICTYSQCDKQDTDTIIYYDVTAN